jgi:hypothetical protein
MAISRVWQSGFEITDTTVEMDFVLAASASTVSISSTKARTGTYSLRIQANNYVYKNSPSSMTQCRVGFHINHVGQPAADVTRVFSLSSGGTETIRVFYDEATSNWQLRAGATTVATVTDTPFSTNNVWHHLAIDVKIHASTGWIYLYRDGVVVASWNGQTTQGAANINRLNIDTESSSNIWNTAPYFDNFYWDDTTGESAPLAPPAYYFHPVFANGNGNYSQWTGSDSDSTNNYLHVDDTTPDGDTTYVRSVATGERDSYSVSDYTIPPGQTATAVIPFTVIKNEASGGTLNTALFTRVSSVDQDSTAVASTTAYQMQWSRQTTKPGGGSWDQSSINSMEVGIKTE